MAELPKFIHEDAALIVAELKADYEQRTGKTLAPADVEQLLINAFAYREMLIRANINDVGRQLLVDFSRGAILEYLGALLGVVRLPAASAETTIQFTLIDGHNGVIIPKGLRVQSMDGKVIFVTNEEKAAPVGTLLLNVKAECTDPGTVGNDYEANKIAVILDPLAYVTTAGNIAKTDGGSDEETDEQLRARIKLAPASFSVAGPRGAYKYFAKSAHPGIIDVSVTSPVPGDVLICPLMEGGEMPSQEVIDNVYAICNADNTRPLTDTVYVQAPVKTDYSIEVNITIITGAIASEVTSAINTKLQAFKAARLNKLGKDIVKSKIAALCDLDGVYDAAIVSPAADMVLSENEYSNCTGITINIVGESDE